MATEKAHNMQDTFLNTVRKKRMPVTIFLTSGVKLQGNITGFDNFCLVLRRGPQMQLVYKHAIATVVPAASVQLHGEEGVEDVVAAAPESAPSA